MRTLKQVQAYHEQIHYRVTCKRCHVICIADEEDFDSFFGIPEHTEDERAWKCPICGHVSVDKKKDLSYSVCDETGKLMLSSYEKERRGI